MLVALTFDAFNGITRLKCEALPQTADNMACATSLAARNWSDQSALNEVTVTVSK